MVTKLTRNQVNAWRLRRQHLAVRAGKDNLVKTVSETCGIQAQVLSAALLAVRARVEGITQEDVEDALWRRHSLVKTWCMRGTLHVLPTSELPLYSAALTTKQAEWELWLQKNCDVGPSEVRAITNEIRQALTGRALTREQLSQEVERHVKLSASAKRHLRSAWGVLLRPAAYQGVLAFGESRGQQAIFVRTEGWTKPRKELTAPSALNELFMRFVRSYGPVGMKEFAHWWGNLGEESKSTLGGRTEDLETVQCEGFRGVMHRSDAEEAGGLEAFHVVRLLPSFDCYMMFYTPREYFVPEVNRGKIFNKEAGWVFPALMIDGSAAGVWALKKRGGKYEVLIEPFRNLQSNEKRGVNDEVSDVGRFLGAPTSVTYGPLDS